MRAWWEWFIPLFSHHYSLKVKIYHSLFLHVGSFIICIMLWSWMIRAIRTFPKYFNIHSLFALAIIAILLNVFDKRTDLLPLDTLKPDIENLQWCQDIFDLNTIPVIKHYHSCYTHGLALNLIHWFLKSYLFSIVNSDIADGDAYKSIFVPFTVHIGWQLIQMWTFINANFQTSRSSSTISTIWFCKNERHLG